MNYGTGNQNRGLPSLINTSNAFLAGEGLIELSKFDMGKRLAAAAGSAATTSGIHAQVSAHIPSGLDALPASNTHVV